MKLALAYLKTNWHWHAADLPWLAWISAFVLFWTFVGPGKDHSFAFALFLLCYIAFWQSLRMYDPTEKKLQLIAKLKQKLHDLETA